MEIARRSFEVPQDIADRLDALLVGDEQNRVVSDLLRWYVEMQERHPIPNVYDELTEQAEFDLEILREFEHIDAETIAMIDAEPQER